MINFILVCLFGIMQAQTPVSMQVDGMSCGFCVNSVDKVLSAEKSISDVKIYLKEGYVTFNIKPGHLTNEEKYMSLITDAGYEPRDFRTGDGAMVFEGKPSNTETAYQQAGTATFKVSGNCGMCKKKIEGAAKSVKGVKSASWDMDTHLMKVTYDSKKAKLDDIHQKIASVGYDTDKVKAKQETYDALHGCCQYDRNEN